MSCEIEAFASLASGIVNIFFFFLDYPKVKKEKPFHLTHECVPCGQSLPGDFEGILGLIFESWLLVLDYLLKSHYGELLHIYQLNPVYLELKFLYMYESGRTVNSGDQIWSVRSKDT